MLLLKIFVHLSTIYLIKGNSIQELVRQNGYPIEEYRDIKTADGYYLTLHRIPHGRTNSRQRQRTPIFLMHGLLGSSDHFIFAGPKTSLGYQLADRGYDVWLGNTRSVSYSRRHEKYNADHDKAFWNFTLHELGVYDLAAMIDFTLEKTGVDKLYYIGHSQGNIMFFILCSERPEYNAKFKLYMGLSPSIYLNNASHPLKGLIEYLSLFNMLGIYEFPPARNLIKTLSANMCSMNIMKDVCILIIMIIAGIDYEQIDKNIISSITKNAPESVSLKQLMHLAQFAESGKFAQYDYGPKLNMALYNSTKPPDYNLRGVTVPAALYYAENDYFVRPENVERIYTELANVVEMYKVPYQKFTHTDFIWAKDAVSILYHKLYNLLKQYDTIK